MQTPITAAIIAAVANRERPAMNETSMAERNWPENMAMVQRLAFKPFLSAVLLLTTRLLKSGVERPKPRPINTTARPGTIFAEG